MNYGFALEANSEDNQAVIWVQMTDASATAASVAAATAAAAAAVNTSTAIAGASVDAALPTSPALLLTGSTNYTLKLRLLGGFAVAGERRRFQVPMDVSEKSVLELLSFCRFIHADSSDMLLLQQQNGRNDDELNIRDIRPLSLRNELLSLQHISAAAAAALSAFPDSLQDDIDILCEAAAGDHPLTFNQRNCVLMRKGEKEVLLFYAQLHAFVLPLQRLQWKQVKQYSGMHCSVMHEPQHQQRHQIGQLYVDRYIREVVLPLIKKNLSE